MTSNKSIIKTKSFIHFGCWNNGLCDKNKGTNSVSKVMNKLNKYVNKIENDVDFISIAGDNYYPEKIKKNGDKIKIIHTNELVSGFDCLPDNVEINMILGNHDLETNIINKEQLYIENENKMEDMNNCFILNTEITKARKKNINFVLQKTYKLSENTLIIMIDTSMYEDDANNYIPCYNEYFQKNGVNDTHIKNIPDLQKLQRENILNKLDEFNNTYDNIVIIGHHPITGWKKKNDNILINPAIKFIELLMSIYEKQPSSNYYYLCADLHLYQKGTIKIDDKMVIKQYIVGTGGAELDTAIPVDSAIRVDTAIPVYSTLVNIYTFTYEMKQNIETNGFLHCIENDKELCFKFIDVNNNSNSLDRHSSKSKLSKSSKSSKLRKSSKSSKSSKLSELPKTIGGKKRRTIKTNKIKTI